MRISDWSSDVCSSDLGGAFQFGIPRLEQDDVGRLPGLGLVQAGLLHYADARRLQRDGDAGPAKRAPVQDQQGETGGILFHYYAFETNGRRSRLLQGREAAHAALRVKPCRTRSADRKNV